MFNPLGKRLIVSEQKPENKTESGILIPENVASDINYRFGKVIASNIDQIPSGIQVIFGKYSGINLENNLVILKEDEVLATKI